MKRILLAAVLLATACGGDHERASYTAQLLMVDDARIEIARRRAGRELLAGYHGPVEKLKHDIPGLHSVDGWGKPILYVSSRDGTHRALVSLGSDGVADYVVEFPCAQPKLDLEAPQLDTVICDGNFVQMQLSFNPDGPGVREWSNERLQTFPAECEASLSDHNPDNPLRIFR